MSDEQAQVTVCIATRSVTRVGGLVVHPSIERNMDWAWAVTAKSGAALGKFATRAGAESYARAIAPLADWDAHPFDLAEAMPWAKAVYAKHKDAIEYARCAAWRVDAIGADDGRDA